MDCHSKREVLEMNEKNVIAWFFFSQTRHQFVSFFYDF